ncbi:MAG: hypothetical protein MHMPM18_001792 [Marteilia pararefringens]
MSAASENFRRLGAIRFSVLQNGQTFLQTLKSLESSVNSLPAKLNPIDWKKQEVDCGDPQLVQKIKTIFESVNISRPKIVQQNLFNEIDKEKQEWSKKTENIEEEYSRLSSLMNEVIETIDLIPPRREYTPDVQNACMPRKGYYNPLREQRMMPYAPHNTHTIPERTDRVVY